MGTKLSDGRWFVPAYAWTRAEYLRRADEAALRVAPAPPIELITDCSVRSVQVADDRPPVTDTGLAGLLEAIGPKLAWQRDALCLEYPELDWFADRDQDAARAVCERCLVRAECRAAGEHEMGVWGATTSRERARLRRAKVA